MSAVIPDMAEQAIDIAIRSGETDNINTFVARSLAPYRSVICASAGYLSHYGMPQRPEE